MVRDKCIVGLIDGISAYQPLGKKWVAISVSLEGKMPNYILSYDICNSYTEFLSC